MAPRKNGTAKKAGRKGAPKKPSAAAPRRKQNASTEFHEQTQDETNPVAGITPALIAIAAREALAQISTVRSASAVLAGIYKRYENQGIKKIILKNTVAKMLQTPEQVAENTRLQVQYDVAAGVLRLADADWTKAVKQAGFEFMAATGDVSERLREQRAKTQGIQAGKKGHDLASNPYSGSPGSPEFVGWRDGHDQGTALRAMIKPGSEHVRHASTQKRSAGRKQAAEPEPTSLERDEAAYRAAGVSTLHSVPETVQ